MLGPNPRKAGTPSNDYPPKTSSTQGNGLMVKAIDEIFRHVEESEKPEAFRVSSEDNMIQPKEHNIYTQ